MRAVLTTILIGAVLLPSPRCVAQGTRLVDHAASHSSCCCDTDNQAGLSELSELSTPHEGGNHSGCGCLTREVDPGKAAVLISHDNLSEGMICSDSHESTIDYKVPGEILSRQDRQLLLREQDPLYLRHCAFRI